MTYFIDRYKKIKRGAQIMIPKDIGYIITATGINKDSTVLDAGSGSGALACYLASIAKKVITYEIREDFIKIVKENKKKLGLKNLTVKKGDVFDKIKEKNIDVIILDLKDSYKAIDNVKKALKKRGFLVVYNPQITQSQAFVNKVDEDFKYIKTIELIERPWKIQGKVVRPDFKGLGFTGFLSFFRKK
ncbi:MAG: methyltransferase domain-containing protein [Candidatus Woesearchaeota archaeon]|nr:MAG: methyltransferase domain-containing protein [Candidatus Woesearchaeota archaeon]